MLTGKCKEQFEEWLNNPMSHVEGEMHHFRVQCGFSAFSDLTQSMQFGVYQDFFDSIGYLVNTRNFGYPYTPYKHDFVVNSYISVNFNSRPEARKAAIQKANEIFNNQNK